MSMLLSKLETKKREMSSAYIMVSGGGRYKTLQMALPGRDFTNGL